MVPQLTEFPGGKFYLGDCLRAHRLIPPHSIDLVVSDLPYETTTIHWDSIIPLGPLWRQYKRVLRPTGAVLLFGNHPFTSMLVMSNLAWYKQCLVWDKNKCGSPGLAKVRPMQVHEDIVVFAPGRTVYNPQMEKGEPYARKTTKEGGYAGKHNRHGYGLKPVSEFRNEGTRYPKSILRVSRDFSAQQQVHPTQKPVPLIEWLIRTYSHKGGRILDSTAGSGTTAIAAIRTGREWVCIERDAEHAHVALARIREAQVQYAKMDRR